MCLLNKHDLADQRALGDADHAALADEALAVLPTSAKSGENIETAFMKLGAALL